MRYTAYGLNLYSNVPIPTLLSSTSSLSSLGEEVRVWMNSAFHQTLPFSSSDKKEIWYTSLYRDKQNEPLLKVWQLLNGSYYEFQYSDGTRFVLHQQGTEIYAVWPESLTVEDTTTYLSGPILGFLLRLRGITCLHASALAVNGQAVALFGKAGAGKSTTAAAFSIQGYPILSEDVVPVIPQDHSFLVQPGYPLIRLWPESVKMLFGSTEALPRLTPNWNKRYLDLTKDSYKFQPEPLPLGAIYMLGDRSDDPAAPFVEPVPSQEALIKLISNTYTNYLLDGAARAHEFEVLGQLIKCVPVRRVIPHKDPARLFDLCQTILDDYQRLELPVKIATSHA